MAATYGISYTDILKMDMRILNKYISGCTNRHEMQVNDNASIAYQGAIWNSLAVWGSKQFPKKPPHISIKFETQKEIQKRIDKEQLNMALMLMNKAESK